MESSQPPNLYKLEDEAKGDLVNSSFYFFGTIAIVVLLLFGWEKFTAYDFAILGIRLVGARLAFILLGVYCTVRGGIYINNYWKKKTYIHNLRQNEEK